jgi:hypothetical protein
MKKILALCLIILFSSINNGCNKVSEGNKIKTFKEEFTDVDNLGIKGWRIVDLSSPTDIARWRQGQSGVDKYSQQYGFPAFSYKNEEDEYAFVGFQTYTSGYSISSWLISPAYEVKNGDKISFYTRAAKGNDFADRLHVRLNEVDNTLDIGATPTSVGKFTRVLKDINENLSINGYPQTWSRYEITISGFSDSPKQTRFAFRYYPDGSKSNAIGIDVFEFTTY